MHPESQDKGIEERYRELLDLQILKDNLINMLAHDLRNPLSGVIGYLSLLEAVECNDICERKACLEYVRQSLYLTRKVCALINDLLDLKRLEHDSLPLCLEEMLINNLVKMTILDFDVQLKEKKINVLIEEDETVKIKADQKLLSRVIGNIISNSIRYSPQRGTISFHIGKDGNYASLVISNEGPFIPENILEKIFEKFYQEEAKAADLRSGAGLGLAFCKLVVQAHGGTINAENNSDKGCRFTISLPF